jgi:hypothetical protein
MNNEPSTIHIRLASKADRKAILSLMRPGDYNPINLKGAGFVVAEADGQIIGIGQIKRHRNVSRLSFSAVRFLWKSVQLDSFDLDKNRLVEQTVPSFSLRTGCFPYTSTVVNTQAGDCRDLPVTLKVRAHREKLLVPTLLSCA